MSLVSAERGTQRTQWLSTARLSHVASICAAQTVRFDVTLEYLGSV